MKTLIIPFDIDKHQFKAEWCLDLYGFLNRKEFSDRLDIINEKIRNLPLLTEKAEKILLWVFSALATFVAGICLLAYYSALYSGHPAFGAIPAGTVVNVILAAGYFIGKRVVRNIAKQRADAFSEPLYELFKAYNHGYQKVLPDNPTANWSLVWRSVLTEYKIKAQSNGKGATMKPKFANHAVIVLEINDALSQHTKDNVRVNLLQDVPLQQAPYQQASYQQPPVQKASYQQPPVQNASYQQPPFQQGTLQQMTPYNV